MVPGAPGTCNSGHRAHWTQPVWGYEREALAGACGPVSWALGLPPPSPQLWPHPHPKSGFYGQPTLRAQGSTRSLHSCLLHPQRRIPGDSFPHPPVPSSANLILVYNYRFKKTGSGDTAGFLPTPPLTSPVTLAKLPAPCACLLTENGGTYTCLTAPGQLDDFTHGKYLEQCLAHSKCSINMSNDYCYRYCFPF